jgi:hypothetical protein
MATMEQCTFESSTEVLDGNEYKACAFRNCRLVYRGGPMPKMAQCHVAGCQWVFEDPADRTLGLLRSIYHGMGAGGRELVEMTFNNIRRPPPAPPAALPADEGAV